MTQYNLGITLAILGEGAGNAERMLEAANATRAAYEVFVAIGVPWYRDLAFDTLRLIERKLRELE